MDTPTGWMFVTRWGNAVLLLPTASWIAVSLWVAGKRGVAGRWAFCFGGAVTLVLATKLAFLGWGIGIRSLDFTGISGHSTLAASVLPMFGWWLTQGRPLATQRGAIVAASLFALVVAMSRVLLATHSIAEVVAGFLLGSLVAWIVIPRGVVGRDRAALRWVVLSALLVAGILPGPGGSEAPHGMVVQLALRLSGRSEPFNRGMW